MIQFSERKKETVITTDTYGAVTKSSVVFDITHDKRRTIEQYTLIKVCEFNFATKKIVIDCIKGTEQYKAEVSVDFLIKHCALEIPNQNQPVNAIMVQHVTHNLLDEQTAIFIGIMVLTYLCGIIIGKVL